MGWSFRKSFRIGKGFRINLSRKGVGWSIGSKLLRLGFGRGRTRVSSGVGPLRYEKSIGDSSGTKSKGGGCVTLLLGLIVLAAVGVMFAPKKVETTKSTSSPQIENPLAKPLTLPPKSAALARPTPTTTTTANVALEKPSTSIPRQVPTGHAADAAKWRAVAIYPKLGIANSPLNNAFISKVKRYQTERPEVFDDKDWPTVIARECEHEQPR